MQIAVDGFALFVSVGKLNRDYVHCCRYKNVSKTDVKQSWLRCPKSRQPKEIVTISDMYPDSKSFK